MQVQFEEFLQFKVAATIKIASRFSFDGPKLISSPGSLNNLNYQSSRTLEGFVMYSCHFQKRNRAARGKGTGP
jgi:hypothetical protein